LWKTNLKTKTKSDVNLMNAKRRVHHHTSRDFCFSGFFSLITRCARSFRKKREEEPAGVDGLLLARDHSGRPMALGPATARGPGLSSFDLLLRLWKTREIPKEHVLNPRGKTGDVNQTSCQTRGQANQGVGKRKFPAIKKVTRRKK
jgi:hypothetical protein